MPIVNKRDDGPLVHIHDIERSVQGSGVTVRVYGELKIAAKEKVYARDLNLNSVKMLVLTPIAGNHTAYIPTTYISQKGVYDNYASVDIFTDDGTEVTAGNGPYDGSLWLSFVAVGE